MKRKSGTSHSTWQGLVIAALIIAFFVGIIMIYYRMLYVETRENIIKNGEMNAIRSSEQVNDYLSFGEDVIELSAFTLDNMIRDRRSNEEILDYLTNQSVAIENIMPECNTGLYGCINGEYLDGSGWVPEEGYDPTERPWYIQARAGMGKIVSVDPYLDLDTGGITIALAKTLCDAKSVVSLDFKMDRLQKIMTETAAKYDSDIEMIIDHKNNVIAHSDKDEVGKNYSREEGTLGSVLAASFSTEKDNYFSVQFDNSEYIVYAIPIGNDWICVSVTNATSVYDRLKQPLILTIIATVLVIAVLLAILVNMNKKQLLAEKMSIQSEKALAASAAKSAFLSNMSHEIRTPINAVLGMNEMILREGRDPDIRYYAENIRSSGNTLLSLINDILDFSKIEAGKMEIVPAEYSLSSVLRDLVNMISTRADAKGLELITEFDPRMPERLYGDEIRIKQVITNILTNAVKYTEKGSVRFAVDFEKTGEETVLLKVSVKDTGIGIRPEDKEKLFTKFERIEEERNRNIEGTGLGMTITKRLLDMMDSELEVESVYGEGSVFSFSLKQKVISFDPIGENLSAGKTDAPEKYHEKFRAPSAEILVVDDNHINLVVFTSLLKRLELRVDTADNGDEAIRMASGKKYDVIFLDHMMPVKDGIETLHEIREMSSGPNADTPAVCLTANAISGAKEQYLSAGFDSYLSKPIDSSALETLLLTLLPGEKITEAPTERADESGK